MKKNRRLDGFLAIELFSGECFFEAQVLMKSDTVALAIHTVFTFLKRSGLGKVIIYMDQKLTQFLNNKKPFHKSKFTTPCNI